MQNLKTQVNYIEGKSTDARKETAEESILHVYIYRLAYFPVLCYNTKSENTTLSCNSTVHISEVCIHAMLELFKI
jgi:hypothetical protein